MVLADKAPTSDSVLSKKYVIFNYIYVCLEGVGNVCVCVRAHVFVCMCVKVPAEALNSLELELKGG